MVNAKYMDAHACLSGGTLPVSMRCAWVHGIVSSKPDSSACAAHCARWAVLRGIACLWLRVKW
jgi:hypothetical protein